MAIKQINLPDGTTLTIDEWLHWPTYSTIEFAAASKPQLQAFQYVMGQRVASQGVTTRNATEADTNQVVKSQVNYDESILVYSVTYECFALSSVNASTTLLAAGTPVLSGVNHKRLCRDLIVELAIGARQYKPQFRAPFSYIGQGPGAPAFVPGDEPSATVRFQYGTGGWPTPTNQRRMPLPVYVQPTQKYTLKVYSPVAITDLDQAVRQRWYLDGLKRRPVG